MTEKKSTSQSPNGQSTSQSPNGQSTSQSPNDQSTSQSPKTNSPDPRKGAEQLAQGREWKKLLKLAEMLKREPELAARLAEALATGRFLITVHFLKKYKPDDQHDQHHWQTNRDYPKADIPASLRSITDSFLAKENPTAQLSKDSGFH